MLIKTVRSRVKRRKEEEEVKSVKISHKTSI